MYGNRRNHKILFWTFVVRSSPVKILPFRLGLVPQIAASLLYDEVLWGLKCITHNWENLSVDGKVNQFFGLIAYIENNQSLKFEILSTVPVFRCLFCLLGFTVSDLVSHYNVHCSTHE